MEDNSQKALLQALRQIKKINLEVLNVDEFSWEFLLLPSSTSEGKNFPNHTVEPINIDLHIQPPISLEQNPRDLQEQDENCTLDTLIQKIKENPAELSEWLREKFYKPDALKKLCLHLKVDFHELEGDGINKITDLVKHLQTREKEGKIVSYLKKYDPELYSLLLRDFYEQNTQNFHSHNQKLRKPLVKTNNGYRNFGNTL